MPHNTCVMPIEDKIAALERMQRRLENSNSRNQLGLCSAWTYEAFNVGLSQSPSKQYKIPWFAEAIQPPFHAIITKNLGYTFWWPMNSFGLYCRRRFVRKAIKTLKKIKD